MGRRTKFEEVQSVHRARIQASQAAASKERAALVHAALGSLQQLSMHLTEALTGRSGRSHTHAPCDNEDKFVWNGFKGAYGVESGGRFGELVVKLGLPARGSNRDHHTAVAARAFGAGRIPPPGRRAPRPPSDDDASSLRPRPKQNERGQRRCGAQWPTLPLPHSEPAHRPCHAARLTSLGTAAGRACRVPERAATVPRANFANGAEAPLESRAPPPGLIVSQATICRSAA